MLPQAGHIALQPRAATTPIRILSQMPFFDAREKEQIEAAAGNVRVELVQASSPADFREKLREAEVVFGGIRAADLDFAPKLKWIQTPGAGMEGFDEKVLKQIPVTNMARIFAPGIAETGIGLLLAISRGIGTYYMKQFYTKRTMDVVGTIKSPDHIELAGRTMGVVGFGGIGYETARRAHFGFGMKIIATDAKPLPKPEWVETLREPEWYRELVKQSDVIVAAAPHTRQTERMFNEEVFRSMKRDAIFIALSRGKLFDDMALVKVLKEKAIRGAGLDVFPMEPPPSTHPIYDCDNVVMTAHTSGWGVERQTRLIAHFAENIRRYAAGLPLLAQVDKEKGY
jgi:phosphoglycerate dehydrogenase-like enzyme